MSGLESLYQELILEHSKRPHGKGIAEPEGAAFKTRAEAEEAEKGLFAKAADAVKDAIGR